MFLELPHSVFLYPPLFHQHCLFLFLEKFFVLFCLVEVSFFFVSYLFETFGVIHKFVAPTLLF